MSNQNINQIHQSVLTKLNSVRRKWRWLLLSENLLIWVSTVALVLVIILLCFQLPLNYLMRIGVLTVSTLFILYITMRILVKPLIRRLSYSTVAAHLEKAYPNIENRVVSTVQLRQNLEDNRLGYATEFIEELISQTHRDVENIESKKIFHTEYTKIKRNAGITVIAVGIFALANLLLPSSLKGITRTFESLPKTAQLGLTVLIEEVQPGNIQVKQGENVTISAKVSGHLDAPVNLFYRVAQTNQEFQDNPTSDENSDVVEMNELENSDPLTWQSLSMVRESIDTPYIATLQNLSRSLQYYITAKDVQSPNYNIVVGFEPLVKSFQIELNYPSYTQLPTKKLQPNIGDIQTLFGTEIIYTGEGNKPLSDANLIFEDIDPVQLDIQNESVIHGSFLAEQANRYHIELLDRNNLTNTEPVSYTLDIYKDFPPNVSIIEPGKDLVLDDDMLVELKVEATDDYGIQILELVYGIQKENAVQESVTLKQIPSNTTPIQSSLFLTYNWDIDPIGLFPGESLSYYVQAIDIDDVSGPNIGKSRTYTLRFPTLDELYDNLSAEQESEQIGIDELFDDQTEATGMVENILDKIRKFRDFSITDKKQMQQVIETQKEIERKANELISQMQQTTAEMEKNQLFDPETIQQYQELQELMKEALSKEHQELLKKLSEALAEQQLTEQERELSDANFNQEQFQQQLERMKSLYEQLILQQKLEAAAKQAQALADQQQELLDSIKNLTSQTTTKPPDNQTSKLNNAAMNEDRIQQDSDNLSKKLDTLGNEMSDLAESKEDAPPQLQKVADELKRLNQYTQDQKLSENLQQTSTNLRNADQADAMETGSEAEQTMTELAQGLDNAMEFMEGSNADQALTAMQEAVTSGLYLSHLHEKIIDNTKKLIVTTPDEYIESEILQLQELAAGEIGAAKSIEQLADKLWELGKQQMEVDPKIVWQLNSAGDALNRAARALEDRQATLALPIQRSGLADLNQAVFDLLTALAQMNQQMGAGGLQSMLEQLQQLAQSQEQLNEMAQTLSKQMREQGQTPGLQQRLDRLASQQQLIREATERLAEIADKAAEMLGSLKDVAEEMAEVEQNLQKGILNEDVIDQQERIVTRMLDSLKSLHQRDLGRRRKAQVAEKNITPPQDVPPLHPELLEYVRKLETTPNAKELENIPFQYREQLRQYFKALSRKTQ